MDDIEIRLECLKLACSRIPQVDVAVATAKTFEAYVNPPVDTPVAPIAEKRGPGRPKKAANPFEE